MAAGLFGTILTSEDGIDWTVQFTDVFETLLDATYGDGRFVVVGQAGTILTSPDGMIWDRRNSGTTQNLHAVTFGGGYFVAVGNQSYYENSNTLLTSTNGIDWVRRDPTTSFPLYGARYLNDTFFLLGVNGTILQSDPLNPIQLAGNWNSVENHFQLTMTSRPGSSFRLQSCDGFSWGAWLDRAVITNLTGTTTFIDTSSTPQFQRFYRAVRD